ncbi:VOC family protein [Pseudochryseolinea flava]|uniref:Glyoxalase/bleomycin resistance/extradiol dioxygenase family protein n=1 Tax=Pseudochryseolinea flava TaxID=2059302 RepID=A0A364Y370_9BACT|nr:VOC family protein [Pseudochryseolinea flava]RAW00420.1 glyoxalase/bleomycin resistance/extradiol dioxygenase family protein [Pseudochryseolinea flava]
MQIAINLPVTDLKRSMDFYAQLGFVNNPNFTDHTAAAMTLSEEVIVMLLTHSKFNEFTKKKIANTQEVIAVINSLSVENRDAVDSLVAKALKAGATETLSNQDMGFMKVRGFADPDGHQWEAFFMDMTQMPTE